MRLVIAEKPSMARAIAQALGVVGKGRSYLQGEFEGQKVLITWCIGHLVELAATQPGDAKGWRFANLPIVPAHFAYQPVVATQDQYETVRALMQRPDIDTIVNATDAGREGQLIFHLVYQLAACAKPVLRLWTSALTEDAIVQAWGKLRDDREWQGLTDAAYCRQHADWLVGINCTRAQTLVSQALGREGLQSIGRVQTPTLAILAQRELEIRNFVPQDFWTLVAKFRTEQSQTYEGKWFSSGTDGSDVVERFDTAAAAQTLRDQLAAGRAHVTKLDKKREARKPELLYDLTMLQREANKRFGYTAEQTLEIAQQLYEAQLISYPRTNSRHLTTDDAQKAPSWLAALNRGPFAQHVQAIAAMGKGQVPALSKRFVNDAEVEDHSALTVTNKPPPMQGQELGLSEPQRRVYELIARRLLAAWFGDRVEQKTVVITAIVPQGGGTEALFKTIGTVLLDPGWSAVDLLHRRESKVVAQDTTTGDAETLPPLRKGEVVAVDDLATKAGKTSAPKPMNEADILAAMQGAGKFVDDEALRGAMKDCGLGTPATRANIIETLIKRGFAERRGRSLCATEAGLALIEAIPLQTLKSPEMTGQWEAAMEQIRRGKGDRAKFMADIVAYVRLAVDSIRNSGAQVPVGERRTGPTVPVGGLLSCPECGSPLRLHTGGGRTYAACTGLRKPLCKLRFDCEGDGKASEKCGHCQGPVRRWSPQEAACVRCGRSPMPPADRPAWPPLLACPKCKQIARLVWSSKQLGWVMRCGGCDEWLRLPEPTRLTDEPAADRCTQCAAPMAVTWSTQRSAWLQRCLGCNAWHWATVKITS